MNTVNMKNQPEIIFVTNRKDDWLDLKMSSFCHEIFVVLGTFSVDDFFMIGIFGESFKCLFVELKGVREEICA